MRGRDSEGERNSEGERQTVRERVSEGETERGRPKQRKEEEEKDGGKVSTTTTNPVNPHAVQDGTEPNGGQSAF